MLSILRNHRLIRVLAPVVAGTTEQKSAGVNCTGLDTIMFMQGVGTITSGGTVKMTLQGSDTDVDGNYVDLYLPDGVTKAEKTLLDGDDDKILALELVRPKHKYNRYVLTRATANSVLDLGLALVGVHPRTLPVSRDASVSAYGWESFVSPQPA